MDPFGQPPADDDRARLDYAQCDIWLRVTSDMERKYRTRSCAKEPFTVQWLEEHVRRGDVVYDVGANVGTFSLIAAKHCGATVVAFEPGYANFARLCENIQLNGCHYSIVPLPFPLAETAGLVGFTYRTLDPGQSRHSLKAGEWRFRDAVPGSHYEQPVCALPLDDAVSQFRLPLPTHIKIDVDGAEARVLGGAGSVLRGEALRTVLIEVDAAQWGAIEATLQGAGFEVAHKYTRDERKAKAPWYGLFVRTQAR